MASAGSISLELKLSRTQFDKDLAKLSGEKRSIAIQAKLDVKDFERQIKGLTGFLPTVLVPVKLDIQASAVRQQFQEIGKQALAGFNQGFQGDDTGKVAADSLVKSVRKGLQIQSPSRVFRDIGEYAAQGLVQGLQSGTDSQVKGVVNRIENTFKSAKIRATVELDIDRSKISALKTSISVDGEIGKNITSAIEQGFKNAKPKTGFLSSIFGGIGSLITAPLAGAFRGAFEGVGTPIGRQVGSGVAKAIQSTLGAEIGSLELISQKAVEKSLAAIPGATNAIVATIKANPIGNAVAKQLELLQRTLERYSINLSPKQAIKSLSSSEERAVASSSATFTSQEAEFKSRKKAKAAASNEFISLVDKQGDVDKISETIKQREKELAAKVKKLQTAQQAIASLEAQLAKIAQLPQQQRATAEAPIKAKIAELSQALAGGTASIEQDTKDIASLKQTKSAYFEKLNNQIKILAELGIESNLSSQSADILKGIEVFEQMVTAQKALQEAQKNVKTNAKTPDAIRGKKLDKLTGLAVGAKTELDKAIASPDATPAQIQQLQKRAAAANKALDLYKLELADPAKEIDKLNQKLANGNAVLAQNIQDLQARLIQAIPALLREASQEVVKVGNLNEIPTPSPSKGQLAIERQALASEKERQKTLELERLKQQKAQQVGTLPKLYVDAVQSVSRIVTGKNLAPEKIPNIVPSSEVAGRGDYNAGLNTYRIRPDLYQQLQLGDINQVADEVIGNIVHEIFHAFQHGFGKAIADKTGQLAVDITPTPEELLKLGDKIESSVAIQPDERKPLSRQLETGANVFQLRNTDRVKEELKRIQLKDQALSLGGVAGSKIGLTDVNKLIDNISAFIKEAGMLGVDISKQRAKYLSLVKDIRTQADSVGAKSVKIDELPTAEIEEIVKQYQQILQTIEDAKTEVASLTQSLPQTKALQQELVIQNQKPQLVRAAKELGIKGVSGKTKEEIAASIVASGVAPEKIKAKLPLPTVDTQKVIAQAQELLQLPTQELEKATKYAVNNFGLKLKGIAKVPDDKSKFQELQTVLAQIDELEKTYIAAKVTTLDESVKNTLQGRILGLQKQRVAATYQLKPLINQNVATRRQKTSVNQDVIDAEISTQRKNLELPPPPPPPWELIKSLVPITPKAKGRSQFPLPPSPAQVDPKFGLPIKLRELFDKVVDAGELQKIVADIQKDQTKSIEQKLKEYDQIIQIYDDLRAEQEKQQAQLEEKFSPEKVDSQRETVRGRAKLSANLERKYGLEGLAPELMPDRIKKLEEVADSPSLFNGIKSIFKSIDDSIAKRVKKRAARLALETETAIAPSLETAAINAKATGNTADAKQFNKLARQSRAATRGIARILESPDDLTSKQVKQLDRLTSQLEKVYDAIGRPLPSQGFLESFGLGLSRLMKNFSGFIKGALAFTATSFLQNFFQSIAKESFAAYVELDKLKTALNFASGGASAGTQNLAFVRKTVEDLKIPLKASTEGFTQLASASRGSALAGKETRELFLGMSQASTVLSLSADDTKGAILALSQMISKGKVSAEELRQQLGERIPGALGIAARAMGVTEAEFTRLLDSGQILSEDFLPKFAKQLQTEFGDAAKDAADNAQSAIFDLQNSFTSLQQGIGEGIAPAATAGLGAFAAILKGVAAVSKELGFILLGVTVALSVKMVSALQAVIAQLIATKLATGTLSGGMAALGQTINNSFSVKLTAGIFAVLEIINLLNQAVNTELVGSFDKAANAAKRAAEESAKAFEKAGGKGQNSEGTPESSSGVGKAIDNSLIRYANFYANTSTFGLVKNPLKTYGEAERDRITQNTGDITNANTSFLSSGYLRLAQLRSRTGDTGQLPAIDATLRDAEQQRQILQAQAKRNFTDKGLAIPAEDKRRLEAQNLRITDLNNQRADIAKPFTLDLSRADQQINAIKAQIESLKSPEGMAAVGGGEAALKLTEQLKGSMGRLKQFKAEAENALASLRVDPVLAFTQSLRQLNLTLAENQEKNEQAFNNRKSVIASSQLAGFSTNKLATRNAALQSAVAERDKNQINVSDLESAISKTDKAIASPEFQTTLQRLGVSPNSSVARIDDLLKNTTDEGDKGILERLKSAREQKNKLSEARTTLSESQLKVKQTTQDNSLFSLEESAASSRAATQKAENQKIALIKQAQADRNIVEEVAAEKLSRIQLASTQSQRKNLDNQLLALRHYYTEGQISAEEFAKRERDLTTEQTNLERTEAENRLAVQQTTLQRKLKEIEFANKKAESAIALNQTTGTTQAKQRLLASGLTQTGQDQFALLQNTIDQKATTDKITLLKSEIAQTKKMRQDGLLTGREAAEKEMALNQELAQNNLQLVDQKIAGEEKYRETVERNIQRIMQAEENRYKSLTSQLEAQKAGLELYSASLERVKTLEESRYNLSKALSDAAISPLETKRDNANRALELSRRLKDDNLDPTVKSAITSQLGALGFGTNELEILAKRSQIEDEIAAKKLEALKLEQDFQKKSLQLDLQRQRISAQTAVYDAQSAQLSAAKSKLEADAALRIAQVKKDPAAIESAKIGIEIANREADLSNQKLDNAIANLGIQDELSRNAILAQEVTQRSAISQQLAADGARKQASALERVEASVKKTSETQHSALSTQHSNVEGWENPYIQKKGEGLFAYESRLNWARMTGQLIETNNRTWTKSDEVIGGGLPPIDKTATMVDAAKVVPAASNIVDSLKMANQGIEQRLDTLSDRILQLANTPRSLSVTTPNPVDDAAKIMNDVSRAAVKGAGL
ncbi:tape measure protein [Nostoc sp. FACHB-110]|uniref:tape measure protein n=1 Tax=Nostoc sp. FACHB-110 TaxID=2692834 RepID=UPI00168251DC|nr:tape measure protein [Nostoc sp. FACHB-110]MBD2437361.1 tape measure protein [Nostoc sp. FACHB-110]